MDELNDFDNVLSDNFDPKQFANDLLTITNDNNSGIISQDIDNNSDNNDNDDDDYSDSDSDDSDNEDEDENDEDDGSFLKTIDLNTSIKKINFDINEINSIYDKTINENSSILLNQLHNDTLTNNKISNDLLASLSFLQTSYQRLNNEILVPYESSQKLQVALNKIHQTSTLLRDSLLYLHIINMIKNNSDNTELSIENTLKLSTLYSQLQLILRKNINLNSLTVIKNLQTNFVKENRKTIINQLSSYFLDECKQINEITSNNNSKNYNSISKLSLSLYQLSSQDFIATINKFVLSNVSTSSNLMAKIINSVKDFPSTFSKVVQASNTIIQLENILSTVELDNNVDINNNANNLLTFYSWKNTNINNINNSTKRLLKPRDLYWNKISQLFKKEVEIAYNRGGPVGKNLFKNKQILVNIMTEQMNAGNKDNLNLMLKTLSILS